MQIRVEFFGIPRARAGVAEATAEGATLGDVFADLASRFPQLADACFDGQALKPGYTANIRGGQFVTDPSTRLQDGDFVLLLSLDAGG